MTKPSFNNWNNWLNNQPRQVASAIAYRAVMRGLPLICDTSQTQDLPEQYVLSTFRACLTVAVQTALPDSKLGDVAIALGADRSRIKADSPASSIYVAAHTTCHVAADSDQFGGDFFTGTYAAYTAGGADGAACVAAYDDSGRDLSNLIEAPINVPDELNDAIRQRLGGSFDQLVAQDDWSFWANWYDRAMAGDPLPWDLQEQVALIPNEIWEAGPEAVAEEIARIEAEFIAEDAQLLETLVLDPSVPVYSAKTVAASNPDRIALHLSRVDDALDDLVALGGNNGLTEATAEYRIIKRLVRKYSDDPERIAFDLKDVNRSISRQFGSGEYPESEPFLLLQAASTACISRICDMEPEVAAELERVYPREPIVPDEDDANVVSEAMVMSLAVLDQPAADTTREDFAELFRNRIIFAAEEDPFQGPIRVARDYRAVVLRRQISRLAQIARDYSSVDRLAEHYDSKYSKASGVVMRYGGLVGVFYAAVRTLGYWLGVL